MPIVRSEYEVERALNACAQCEEAGDSSFWGMTYEQGVAAAINWLTRVEEPHPLGEEE